MSNRSEAKFHRAISPHNRTGEGANGDPIASRSITPRNSYRRGESHHKIALIGILVLTPRPLCKAGLDLSRKEDPQVPVRSIQRRRSGQSGSERQHARPVNCWGRAHRHDGRQRTTTATTHATSGAPAVGQYQTSQHQMRRELGAKRHALPQVLKPQEWALARRR